MAGEGLPETEAPEDKASDGDALPVERRDETSEESDNGAPQDQPGPSGSHQQQPHRPQEVGSEGSSSPTEPPQGIPGNRDSGEVPDLMDVGMDPRAVVAPPGIPLVIAPPPAPVHFGPDIEEVVGARPDARGEVAEEPEPNIELWQWPAEDGPRQESSSSGSSEESSDPPSDDSSPNDSPPNDSPPNEEEPDDPQAPIVGVLRMEPQDLSGQRAPVPDSSTGTSDSSPDSESSQESTGSEQEPEESPEEEDPENLEPDGPESPLGEEEDEEEAAEVGEDQEDPVDPEESNPLKRQHGDDEEGRGGDSKRPYLA